MIRVEGLVPGHSQTASERISLHFLVEIMFIQADVALNFEPRRGSYNSSGGEELDGD